MILTGGPLEGYKNLNDGCDGMNCTQTNKLKDWLLPIKTDWTLEQEKCEGDKCGTYNAFTVAMFSGVTFMDEIMFWFTLSAGFVVFAFIFVFCFFWY